jgi:hypothetical protein
MYTEFDIYSIFRKVQAEQFNRGYRLPKDWVKYYTEKLSKNQQEILTRSSKYFSTVWNSINIENYFECGFQLYPKFNFHHFFDKNIMKLYIQKDKNRKNDLRNMKKSLIDSCKFVMLYMKDKKHNHILNDYCKLTNEKIPVIINHYLNNDISNYFLAWMIAEGYVDVYDYRPYVETVIKNYRVMYAKLNEEQEFLEKIKNKIVQQN